MIGRWFSPGTPVSSTNKIDHHDITEIFLKVALNTINQTKPSSRIVVKSCTLIAKRLESQINLKKICEQVNQGHIQNINNRVIITYCWGRFTLALIKNEKQKIPHCQNSSKIK